MSTDSFLDAALTFFNWLKTTDYSYSEEAKSKIRDIYRAHILTSDKLNKLISERDVIDTIYHTPLYLRKPIEKITDNDFKKYIEMSLLTPRKMSFYFPIYNLIDIESENIKFGQCEMLKFNDLTNEVQSEFECIWTDQSKYMEKVNLDSVIDFRKTLAFAKVDVEVGGLFKAYDSSRTIAEKSLDILRLVYNNPFKLVDSVYVAADGNIGSETYYMETNESPSLCRDEYKKYILDLTEIFLKAEKDTTRIEKKLRNVLKIYGIKTSTTDYKVQFILMLTCLECLLLTKNEKDYINWKLAEKAAFLSKDKRYEINEFLKLSYNKRSIFIHGEEVSKEDENITLKDVHELEKIFFEIYLKILELRQLGLTNIEDLSNPIEKIKFSTSAPLTFGVHPI